jgi:hypothetical protein
MTPLVVQFGSTPTAEIQRGVLPRGSQFGVLAGMVVFLVSPQNLVSLRETLRERDERKRKKDPTADRRPPTADRP